MPEKQPKQSDETREALRSTDEEAGEVGPAALTRGGKPNADKPTFQEVEDSSIRERREVAAQVRSGSKATALEPAPEVAQDPRTPEEIAKAQEESDASHDAGASALVNTFDGDEAPELKDREPEAPQQLVNTFDETAGREPEPPSEKPEPGSKVLREIGRKGLAEKRAAEQAAADEKAKK